MAKKERQNEIIIEGKKIYPKRKKYERDGCCPNCKSKNYTYLEIDTAYLGLLWNLDDGDIVANGEEYNYNFLNYSNIIDVNTTPSKRAYQIIYIDDDNMVVKTPKQYVDDSGALQTREAILEFERIN